MIVIIPLRILKTTLLEGFEWRYEERIKRLNNVQKVCGNTVQEVENIYRNLNEVGNNKKNKQRFSPSHSYLV